MEEVDGGALGLGEARGGPHIEEGMRSVRAALLHLAAEERHRRHGNKKQEVAAVGLLLAGSRQIPRERSEGERIHAQVVEAGARGGELELGAPWLMRENS